MSITKNPSGRVLYLGAALLASWTAARTPAAILVVNGDFNTTAERASSGYDGTLTQQGYGTWNNGNTTDINVIQDGGATVNLAGSVPGWSIDPSMVGRNYIEDWTGNPDPGNTHLSYAELYTAGGVLNDGLYQDIGTSVAGAAYTVGFETAMIGSLGDSGYRVQLYEGASLLGELGGVITSPTFVPLSFTTGPALGGSTLRIRLRADGSVVPGDRVTVYDNITVTEFSIPEPGMALLVGLGAATVFTRRKLTGPARAQKRS